MFSFGWLLLKVLLSLFPKLKISPAFIHVHFDWHRLFGTILHGRSVQFTSNRTPKLWPFSVYEGICLSSFTGCKPRLHPPINDHYQPNDSSGWPGKIKMGITSRQIRYFYLCMETYTFMECCFWIVQWMDCSWNSASRGFNNSTAVFGASFTGLKPVSLLFEYFDETQTIVCGGRLLVCWNLKQQYQHRHLFRCEVLMWGHSSVK